MYNKFFKKSTIFLLVAILLLPSLVFAKVPSDPYYSDQKIMWDQVGAPKAWNYTTGSKRVVVAIVDTGADSSHEDLSANMWQNPLEIAGNGIDDDNNGYIDDVNGWNFVDNNNDIRTSVLNSDGDGDAVRHGTVIAGIIGAASNNLDGVGLNWDVRIMPLISVNGQGSGNFADVAKAIDYAVNNGADVITMSLVGTEYDEFLDQSLRNAYSKGVVVVAAAGNDRDWGMGNLDDYPVYPACSGSSSTVNYVLTVGSVDESNRTSEFSNYGSCVDIYAPGEGVFSTERYAPRYGYNKNFGGGWRGTSFAAPFVAGTAALIKSLHPSWGPDKIIKTILDSASNFYDSELKMDFKVVNVGSAVTLAAKNKEIDVMTTRLLTTKNNRIIYKSRYGFSDWPVGYVPDAKIVSTKDIALDYGKQRLVATLVTRGYYYYFDVFTYPKSTWREFSVGASGKYQVQDFGFFPSGGSASIITKEYDKKTKQTRFVEYDWLARKILRSVSTKETVSTWTFDSAGQYIEIKFKQGKKLTTKRLKWYN